MNTRIDMSLIDGDIIIDHKKIRDIPFGEGLSFAPVQARDTYSSGGWVIKDSKLLATCDFSPIGSCEDSGYFLVVANPEKNTYRICNSKGQIFKREFGGRSGPFVDGLIRLEIIDEPIGNVKADDKHDETFFTFARVSKDGTLKLMKHRFSYAAFIDRCGLGKVKLVGEKDFSYVTKRGKLLPYKFSKAEDFFRDGIAPIVLNGFHGFLREDGCIVKIKRDGSFKVVMTPDEYETQMQENGEVVIEANEGLSLTQWIERDLTYDI